MKITKDTCALRTQKHVKVVRNIPGKILMHSSCHTSGVLYDVRFGSPIHNAFDWHLFREQKKLLSCRNYCLLMAQKNLPEELLFKTNALQNFHYEDDGKVSSLSGLKMFETFLNFLNCLCKKLAPEWIHKYFLTLFVSSSVSKLINSASVIRIQRGTYIFFSI